jgi:protoporphyrinogen oxidase
MALKGKKAVVLGAGCAGLWIARRLLDQGCEVEVLEKSPQPGGLMETIAREGFLFDLGPHILVASHQARFREILGNALLNVRGFYGFGYRGRQILSPLNPGNLFRTLGYRTAIPLAVGMAWHRLPLVGPRPPWRNVDELITARFGNGINEALFRNYIPKVTGLPSLEVSEDWFLERHRFYKEHSLERQLARKTLALLRNRFLPRSRQEGPAGLDLYYPKNGAQMLTDALHADITGRGARVRLGVRVNAIRSEKGRVRSLDLQAADGAPAGAEGDLFVSTLPVTELPALFGGALGAGADRAARALAWRHLWLFFAAVDRERVSDKIQIYFTEKEYPFKRVYEPKNLIAAMGSAGRSALCAEVCYSQGDAVDRADEQANFARVRDGLCRFYGLAPDQVRFLFSRRVPFSYAVYRSGYRQHLTELAAALFPLDNFVSYGRQGSFRYNHLVDRIVDAADGVVQCLAEPGGGKKRLLQQPDAKSEYF